MAAPVTTPFVQIGIVLYNSLADLPACIAALNKLNYPDSAWRVTLLDNASPDKSAAWVEAHHAEIRCFGGLVRSDQNLGFAGGHNLLIHRALPNSDFYLALNPDAILDPDYVAELAYSLLYAGAGMGIGKLLLPDQTDSPKIYSVGHGLRRGGYAFNIGHGMVLEPQFEKAREIFGAPGAAALYSVNMIRAYAPEGDLYDTDLFLYGEDTDLDWRVRWRNATCWYEPRAVAVHRGSTPGITMQMQATANRHLSALKNADWIDLLTYNLPLMALHCAARMVISPRVGWLLMRRILRLAPKMLRKRRTVVRNVTRAQMNAWYRWSAAQPTGQPKSLRARIGQARND